jgi:hypothetical protein
MLSTLSSRLPAFRTARALRAAAVLSTLALAAACDDDDELTGEDEPEIESVRLIVTPPGGTPTTYTVRVNGGASPSPIQLRVGTSAVTAQALDAAGATIDLANEFELRVVASVTGSDAGQQTPLTGTLTYTGNGTLTGALVATAATTANVAATVRMVHKEEAHSDFDAGVQLRVAP